MENKATILRMFSWFDRTGRPGGGSYSQNCYLWGGRRIHSVSALLLVFQILMFPRQDYGRFSVTDDGTLIIEPVRKDDQGEYVCQALNVAGTAFAKARVTVKGQLTPLPLVSKKSLCLARHLVVSGPERGAFPPVFKIGANSWLCLLKKFLSPESQVGFCISEKKITKHIKPKFGFPSGFPVLYRWELGQKPQNLTWCVKSINW